MFSVKELKIFYLSTAVLLVTLFLLLSCGLMPPSSLRAFNQNSTIFYAVLGVVIGVINIYSWIALVEAMLTPRSHVENGDFNREKLEKIVEFISFKTSVILLLVLTLLSVPSAIWPLAVGFSSLLFGGLLICFIFLFLKKKFSFFNKKCSVCFSLNR